MYHRPSSKPGNDNKEEVVVRQATTCKVKQGMLLSLCKGLPFRAKTKTRRQKNYRRSKMGLMTKVSREKKDCHS